MLSVCAHAQMWSFSGVILDKDTENPVEFATVILESTGQWAVADENGRFSVINVQQGKNVVTVSCLGYVSDTREITINRDIENFRILLSEDNLALDGATVTAEEKDNTATTSRFIDKTALDHVQIMNVSDISGLLPGGVTSNPNLTSQQTFDIRAGMVGTEAGNSSFGTAVEVDGVRLSNNARFSSLSSSSSGIKGLATNNIASTNVESVEVITGVPSVEYGDMTSGVVKINTRKGATPYIITSSTNPNTKQLSVSKGFNLGESGSGRSRGIINANLEYTRAVSEKMSPYTAYDRKQLSLTYSNSFNKGAFAATPLQFSAGVSGNLGGMDSKADPDKFLDTFTKGRDNSVRGNVSLNWLLSKSWITNLELNASIVYSDNSTAVRKNYSSSSSTSALHGREEGYFVAQDHIEGQDQAVVLIPRGYWYNTMCVDDRPLNWKIALKANWARQWGDFNNKVKIGADWSGDGNFGTGEYSEDMSNAPSFREYRYDMVPFMNNVAAYVEDNLLIHLGEGKLNIIAGLRSDNAIIRGSEYGVTSGLSPRFNTKYTVFSPQGRKHKTVRELSFRASWGMAAKLPSFSVLFPAPTYRDIQTFTPTSGSDGKSYPAYYISPRSVEYNPDLKWQRSRQSEVGMEVDVKGWKLSLTAFHSKTLDAYRMHTSYSPFSYNYTSAQALQGNCTIPVENRMFEVDRQTGQVTVHDKTGVQKSELIPFVTKKGLDQNTIAANSENPIVRYGLEWIMDFKKIEAVHTSIRLDGTYYGYRNVSTDIIENAPYTITGSDGEPYKYVGFYYGNDAYGNGSESRTLKTNLTVTTQIPKVRMIVSVKLQATLLRYTRILSERTDGSARSHMLSDRSDVLSTVAGSVYDGDGFAVTYPDYYSTVDDPDTKRNYLEDLKWAKENDADMYNDLSKLALVNNFVWWYGKDYISPYFSANISVTKEIGDLASISFYANNFFNNMGQVRSSKTGEYTSVGNSNQYVPKFFYGLSLRLSF